MTIEDFADLWQIQKTIAWKLSRLSGNITGSAEIDQFYFMPSLIHCVLYLLHLQFKSKNAQRLKLDTSIYLIKLSKQIGSEYKIPDVDDLLRASNEAKIVLQQAIKFFQNIFA